MRRLAVAVAATATLAVGGVALAQTTGDERIYACVNNGDGTMRQVAGPEVACAKNWHQISWASENPQTPTLDTYQRSTTRAPMETQSTTDILIGCDPGDLVTGGGYWSETPILDIRQSSADGPTADNWLVRVTNPDPTTQWFAQAFVTCLDTAP